MDTGPLNFSPTADFFSEAFDSYYCTGLRYTAEPDNHRLRDAVAQWAQEGKVRLLPASGGTQPARMGGAGTIGS